MEIEKKWQNNLEIWIFEFRAQYGIIHIINNDYSNSWDKYATSRSEDPTILSKGNYFKPKKFKEVTRHFNEQNSQKKVASMLVCLAQRILDIIKNIRP